MIKIVLLLCITSNSFASMQFLRKSGSTLRRHLPMQQFMLLHTSRSTDNLSQKDLDKIGSLFDQKLDNFHEKRKDDSRWDLPHARKKMISSLEDQGYSEDDAKQKFKELDTYIDKKRVVWNTPYFLTLGVTVTSMPLTYLLVYNENFYSFVLEHFPWLEHTSWDWTEPLVQTLLTTQTQSAIVAACVMALGFRPYSRYRNVQLAQEISKKWGIPLETSKRFIKVDN
jgi:hypothetical protein